VTPPFGKCVWCERTDFTEEHIIGRQFTKAIGIGYPAVATWGDFRLPGRTGIVLKDRVCDTCNKNWMRKIDNKAISWIGPALRDDRIQLDQRKQEVVSMWATKVALLLALRHVDLIAQFPELAENGNTAWVPASSFAAIEKSKRRPPAGTSVWMGSLSVVQGPPFLENVGWLMEHDLKRPGHAVRGYLVLFRLRRFVIYVNGWEGASPRGDLTPAAFVSRRALRRIWPVNERVAEWPPPEMLTQNDWHSLTGPVPNGGRPPEGRRRLVGTPERPNK
jgi:hypothetical protein